jgi:hypothetical protein
VEPVNFLDCSMRMYVEFEFYFFTKKSRIDFYFNGLTFLYKIHPMSLKKLYCFQKKKTF